MSSSAAIAPSLPLTRQSIPGEPAHLPAFCFRASGETVLAPGATPGLAVLTMLEMLMVAGLATKLLFAPFAVFDPRRVSLGLRFLFGAMLLRLMSHYSILRQAETYALQLLADAAEREASITAPAADILKRAGQRQIRRALAPWRLGAAAALSATAMLVLVRSGGLEPALVTISGLLAAAWAVLKRPDDMDDATRRAIAEAREILASPKRGDVWL